MARIRLTNTERDLFRTALGLTTITTAQVNAFYDLLEPRIDLLTRLVQMGQVHLESSLRLLEHLPAGHALVAETRAYAESLHAALSGQIDLPELPWREQP